MKNQYFGDISDYRKYGLLRALQSKSDGHLLVAWMLTPDDGSRDGGLRSYLDAPAKWSKHDPDLFTGLTGLLRSRPPAVSLIEGSDLLPRTAYYSALVPDGNRERGEWRADLLRTAAGADLVFLDPDNGIEVRSKPVGRAGSSKYVTWGEIEALWTAGSSLLIYQHFCREPRRSFAERLAKQLRACASGGVVEALQTPHVLYLLAVQERHARQFGDPCRLLSHRWIGQISAMEFG